MTVTFSTPGPSQYSVSNKLTSYRWPTFRIGLKSPIKRDHHIPGPGSYVRDDSADSIGSGSQSFRFP